MKKRNWEHTWSEYITQNDDSEREDKIFSAVEGP